MAEFTSEGYLDLSDAEKDSEISQYEAGLAGIVSGLIKVPEGIVSLGAELIDLGLDTNSAAQVEQFFDDINPFEEIADKKVIMDKFLTGQDWDDRAKIMLERKEEWHHLGFFEQSEWKTRFFEIEKERFKMVLWN